MLTLGEVMAIDEPFVTKENILSHPSSSHWIKAALIQLEQRDVCDALDDLDMLKIYFEKRFDKITEEIVQWS